MFNFAFMLQFAPCKINIGLNILNKRSDNYHNLETIFYPLNWFDALEITDSDKFIFNSFGIEIKIPVEKNLITQAYNLLKNDFSQIQNIKISLLKKIPMGAGLGGGSSDAALMLKLLNEKFQLKLTLDELKKYALLLGSDCPFFIDGKPAFASGRGEILENIQLDLSTYRFVVVKPNIHISTAWAFSQIKPNKDRDSLFYMIQTPIETWKHSIVNDFEFAIIKSHPRVLEIKNILYDLGAVYSSMSGSGSAVYGVFKELPNKELINQIFQNELVFVQ